MSDAATEKKQPAIEPIRLLIAIPSRGDWQQTTSLSLAFLVHTLTENKFFLRDGKRHVILWNIHAINTSILPQSRQNAVDTALRNNVDYLLFLDDDMAFPAHLVHEWINENRPVMAANCPTRGFPCNPTARKQSHTAPGQGSLVYSDLANYRFEKVWRVGTGVMMLRQDALKALPRPAFTPRWEPMNDAYVGEDWVMCEHLEAAGIPIIVDHEISQLIGHVGSMTFTHEQVVATRKVDAKLHPVSGVEIGKDSERQHNGIILARG